MQREANIVSWLDFQTHCFGDGLGHDMRIVDKVSDAAGQAVAAVIATPPGMSQRDARLLSLCRVGMIVGTSVHVGLQITMMALDQPEVAIFNVFGLVMLISPT
ncbi:hypothetical protein TRICHSKD4_3440 [Roseibium sp. TrichSKD4]|nr:hypothetical protein TRICHSKD4_3440 [Roseibium sp. TrichSKD4]